MKEEVERRHAWREDLVRMYQGEDRADSDEPLTRSPVSDPAYALTEIFRELRYPITDTVLSNLRGELQGFPYSQGDIQCFVDQAPGLLEELGQKHATCSKLDAFLTETLATLLFSSGKEAEGEGEETPEQATPRANSLYLDLGGMPVMVSLDLNRLSEHGREITLRCYDAVMESPVEGGRELFCYPRDAAPEKEEPSDYVFRAGALPQVIHRDAPPGGRRR